jgi:hypothetical protein
MVRPKSRLGVSMKWTGSIFVSAFVGAALGAALVLGSGVSLAAESAAIAGCVGNALGNLRIVPDTSKCHAKLETPLRWNQQGPAGQPGTQGPKGDQGPAGQGGVSNYQVLFSVRTVAASSAFSLQVVCPEPRRALSGGYSFQDFPEGLRYLLPASRTAPVTRIKFGA